MSTTELDKSRRYLRPVAATIISDDPNGVHLAVYEWLPMFDAWATGPGLCGESMRQGPLPEGTAVTCQQCEEWRPKYERMLTTGYRAEDDDPNVLRARVRAALPPYDKPVYGDTSRGVRIGWDRARQAALDALDGEPSVEVPGVREVRIVVQAPTDENAASWAATIRDLVVAEYGQEMCLDVTITPGGQT